jgi:hypothetical protein
VGYAIPEESDAGGPCGEVPLYQLATGAGGGDRVYLTAGTELNTLKSTGHWDVDGTLGHVWTS